MTLLLFLRPHGVGVVAPPYTNPVPFAWADAGAIPDEFTERLAFTTVLCKSTGEPVDILDKLAARQITQQLNLPTSYTITMRMDDAAYPFALLEQQPRLKVYRVSTPEELAVDPLTVNQLVFYGTLPSQGIEEDASSGLAKLSFQDPMWVLNDRYVTTSTTFAQVDQGLILWQIIAAQNARTNGDTWIRQGGTTTGTLRDRTYDAGKQVSGLIQDMTQVDGGCDVSFTPRDYWSIDGTRAMGTFNAHTQRGSDQRDQEFVYAATLDAGSSGGLHGNVGGMKRTRAKTLTSATSVGSADTQTYQNTSSAFGLLEDFETFSDVSISQTLLDKSVGKVGNAQNAPMILEISDPTREAPQPILDYNLGDTVYATCRRGGMEFYSLPLRVHGIDIAISENGVIQTKPTLASTPETIVSPVLGGGVGSEAPPVGGERVTRITSAVDGTIAVDSTIQYLGEDSVNWTPQLTLSPAIANGSANGLDVGTDYTVRAHVRGPDAAPLFACTVFRIFVGTWGSGTEVLGVNDAAHINNALQATRQTWTELSVTFTATSSSMPTGIEFVGADATQLVYSAHWTITQA